MYECAYYLAREISNAKYKAGREQPQFSSALLRRKRVAIATVPATVIYKHGRLNETPHDVPAASSAPSAPVPFECDTRTYFA